ncbi:MAG: alkene reductase [Mucilaginibacter sp.]|uniref:alkene reductase n=1 Tax=Mucilaginibacter sp. TaxID=1882438 RepID=UPI0031B37CE0
MKKNSLFDSFILGSQQLNNRVIMSPMTRTRSSAGDEPNALTAKYYGQRASAGLIITEAVNIAPHGKGYLWTPGIYTTGQIEGWRHVTDQVHDNGGKIFAQIWHVGRMSHVSMMPGGEAPWGVTNEQAVGWDVFAHDEHGKLTFVPASVPRELRTDEIPGLVNDFRNAFKNMKEVGFDGVELHAANGYIFEQFMNATLNTRTDHYGGQTVGGRLRFTLEVVDAAIEVLGAGNVGVRLSPFGTYNGIPDSDLMEETYFALIHELQNRGIGYIHLVYELLPKGNIEQAVFENETLPVKLLKRTRDIFKGAIIWCGGFNQEKAQDALDTGLVDLIAFGRPFIANPDLVERFRHKWPIAVADRSAFYTRNGEVGYTDFPFYNAG